MAKTLSSLDLTLTELNLLYNTITYYVKEFNTIFSNNRESRTDVYDIARLLLSDMERISKIIETSDIQQLRRILLNRLAYSHVLNNCNASQLNDFMILSYQFIYAAKYLATLDLTISLEDIHRFL